MRSYHTAVLIAAIGAGACALDVLDSGPLGPEVTQIAISPPTRSLDTAEWSVADLTGLFSDGGGTYTHGVCGVEAVIHTSVSGDATLNLPGSSGGCAGPRRMSVNLGGTHGTRSAWFMNVRQVRQLTPGNTRMQDLRIYVSGLKACEWVEFNAVTGGQVLVTAGTDGLERNTWIAESVGSHSAGCYRAVKGKYSWDGIVRSVPFRVSITER